MIQTARLLLRPWREADKPAFHALANTPAMMVHFGGPTTRGHHDIIIDRQIDQQSRFGHCMWAVDKDGELAGVCGLRIAERYWGQGIAREAAEASLAWGWANTDRPRIAAWTIAANTRSWGLMERLGMRRREDLDFRHPDFAAQDPFGAMIVYAVDRP